MGFVEHDAEANTYELSAEGAATLADESSPTYLAGGLYVVRPMAIGQ